MTPSLSKDCLSSQNYNHHPLPLALLSFVAHFIFKGEPDFLLDVYQKRPQEKLKTSLFVSVPASRQAKLASELEKAREALAAGEAHIALFRWWRPKTEEKEEFIWGL